MIFEFKEITEEEIEKLSGLFPDIWKLTLNETRALINTINWVWMDQHDIIVQEIPGDVVTIGEFRKAVDEKYGLGTAEAIQNWMTETVMGNTGDHL